MSTDNNVEKKLHELSFNAGVQTTLALIVRRLVEDPTIRRDGLIQIKVLLSELEELQDIQWDSHYLDEVAELLKNQEEQPDSSIKAFHCLDLHR